MRPARSPIRARVTDHRAGKVARGGRQVDLGQPTMQPVMDTYDFGSTELPRTRRQQQTTSGGRRLGGADPGTVAIAMTGMAFYWMMPALMGRSGRRRRPPRRSGGGTG